ASLIINALKNFSRTPKNEDKRKFSILENIETVLLIYQYRMRGPSQMQTPSHAAAASPTARVAPSFRPASQATPKPGKAAALASAPATSASSDAAPPKTEAPKAPSKRLPAAAPKPADDGDWDEF
ncbi:hypothetical protein P3G55_25645, partial [Leptospira sp. 96542]|nr:hypothetical protein [Leptospira sp. 96542]